VDEGHATPEEVDRLFGIFFQTDATPFRMMDTVGLDVVADIESQYIAVSPDPTDRGSKILAEKVGAGELGEKTGKGFYDYRTTEG
jgi:3-hydroxybutyryl-CoA dehydrogenase